MQPPFFVASPGIEPGSGASETLILSIVLQGRLHLSGGKSKCLLTKIAHIASEYLYCYR